MKIKTKFTAFALAAACSFGICAAAAPKSPEILPFLSTDSTAVIEMIDSITVADLTTEKQIEEAFVAYCDLEDSAKEKVSNYEKLNEMRNEIAKLYNSDAESKQGGTLVDRSQFLVGTYCVNGQAWTDEHFQALKDCNIDVICSGAYNTTFLDLCEKYGIGTYVNYIPHWFVGSIEARGQIANNIPLGSFESYAENFVDHPAIWGLNLCDEPHELDYPHLELLRREAEELFPDKLIYINLCPSGINSGGYGYEPGYEFYDYINDYNNEVSTDYISFDKYVLTSAENGLYLLGGLAVMGETTRNAGKDFWYIPQVSSDKPDVWVTTQQLRYEAFNAMTFGVKAINWACWTAGWWSADNQVVDSKGNITEQYEKLKTVNYEVKTLSSIYMRYTNKDAIIASVYPYYMNYKTDYNTILAKVDNDLDQNVIKDITISDNSTTAIGYFEKNIGNGTAFMFSNATDHYCGEPYNGKVFDLEGQDVKITFKLVAPNAELTAYHKDIAYKLTPDENGAYTLNIPNGEGIFVTIDTTAE